MFQSRDEAQAENYRKMMVAMATDIRVILIKLADRLHNMRTIDAMSKQKQIDKAKETLEIYAPIAHRLGIHAIKWELEDLAFAALHPRKYQEIKGLVNQQREERERYVSKAGGYLAKELEALGIEAEISGRAIGWWATRLLALTVALSVSAETDPACAVPRVLGRRPGWHARQRSRRRRQCQPRGGHPHHRSSNWTIHGTCRRRCASWGRWHACTDCASA